ncbi:CRISPR-associated endonuclease Cas1 [Pilibacter termitis]|uniref:CRISPR-associated endonuclease Cas1 n=1 Tax=Pilibacter termitis TaxID=263852 RepID=A0A1T4LEQ9_9ENTE|nr:type II CRISPR-associated endonuclease Cas1 [Pilibacter termitis]SJZ53047.1 CRISPR-associated endonuclease Cas1 [Pilibacter termitis]
MTWRTVVINQHCKLSYQNNHLIFKSSEGVEKIHLSEIHTLLLETTDIAITTALIFKLAKYNVRLIFCDDKRNPLGELTQYYGSHDSSKKLNQQLMWEENVKKEVWTQVIRQKIDNQRRHLMKNDYLAEAEMLSGYLEQLQLFDTSNREGHSAKVYFNALFGKKFTRDEPSEINAFLDYGYSLLLSIFNREIVKNGHLTQLGLKHSNYFNHFNLSSDLMEPFRVVVDEKVYELRNKNFAKNKHHLFEIFNQTYCYNNNEMYLVNIVEHYVKKTLQALAEADATKMMEFRISEL